jgi:hypothetical protein
VTLKVWLAVPPWPSLAVTVRTRPLTKPRSRVIVSVSPEMASVARGSSAGAAGIRVGSA